MEGGDRRALARLISWIENGSPGIAEAVALLYRESSRTYCLGITGAPGSGKSTLTDRLIAALRERGQTVAVLAVDPSSPFSGGAVLGDRIRMSRHAGDLGVFIRSLANRGHLGGLSAAVPQVARALDAFGVRLDDRRDGGRGSGRGGGRRRDRHDRRRRDTRLGRPRASEQGGAPRNRGRLRRQQGRPSGGEGDCPRPEARAQPRRGRARVATADRAGVVCNRGGRRGRAGGRGGAPGAPRGRRRPRRPSSRPAAGRESERSCGSMRSGRPSASCPADASTR